MRKVTFYINDLKYFRKQYKLSNEQIKKYFMIVLALRLYIHCMEKENLLTVTD